MDLEKASAVVAGVTHGPWVPVPQGIDELLILAELDYGAGGGAIIVYVQSALGEAGDRPFDIAAFEFGTASESLIAKVKVSGSKGAMRLVAEGLPPGTVFDGFLGSLLRVVTNVTGDYKDTSLRVTTEQR